MRFVGRISYPLYLYHVGALALASRLTALPVPARMAIGVAAGFAAACASWWLVEKPFLRLKERLPHAHASPRPVPPPLSPLPAVARVAVPE